MLCMMRRITGHSLVFKLNNSPFRLFKNVYGENAFYETSLKCQFKFSTSNMLLKSYNSYLWVPSNISYTYYESRKHFIVALSSLNSFFGRSFSCTACVHQENGKGEGETWVDSETKEDDNGEEYQELARHWLHLSQQGHQLFVIQPYIKWGAGKKYNTTPELQLAEAVALVDSVPKWTVVEKMIMPLKSFAKKTFFGFGNYQMLKEKITKDRRITAVFISTRMLKGVQHRELEDEFGVPVFDRYAVVMQILREHAITKEAKLQVAMAEIPYLRSRLRDVNTSSLDKADGAVGSIGGPGETYLEVQRRVLLRRENKLKQMLEKLREQRELLRNKRRKLEYPVVAVIGYTNAGKTSLIQALTGNMNLQPKDKLFATLDVTVHMGMLPCCLKVLFVDTIGFISDIPTSLIESFVATLEDAMLADAILHVRDISHPDTGAQAENVATTLKGLNLNSVLMENIVVAGNKVDLVGDLSSDNGENYIPVSATKHTGLEKLLKAVEEVIFKTTGRQCIIIRVPTGSPESRWLYKQAAVTEVIADPNNNQYLLMKVVISPAQLSKFRSYFT